MSMAEVQITQRRTHVAVLSSPGMGHLIPLAGFANLLAADHGVDVTFIATSAGPPSAAQLAYLDALADRIHTVHLPPADLHDLPKPSKIETVISHTVVRSLPALRDALRQLPPAALVVDLFCTPAFDVARELGVRPYIFFPSTSTALSLFLHLPELDKRSESEYRDWPDKIRLPGCVPINGSDLLDPVQNRKDEAYSWMVRQTRRYPEAEGIFVNSFADLEPGPITCLKSTPGFPTVYPIGPLIQAGTDATGSQCMKWLDKQPAGSVLFVSFGSGGTLSAEQTAELALGLELSEQRFLWVVRSPSETESNAAFFNEKTRRDPLAQLPDGFLRRTCGAGLVVPSWAPQIQVLGHAATSGFLTHCGWNSTLESVVEGVPLIAWPLYAEQKMNAVMLAEEVGVALRPSAGAVVGREEVARVVKALMEGAEGKRLRSRMKELKDCGARALGPGGSSYKALSQVVTTWRD